MCSNRPGHTINMYATPNHHLHNQLTVGLKIWYVTSGPQVLKQFSSAEQVWLMTLKLCM